MLVYQRVPKFGSASHPFRSRSLFWGRQFDITIIFPAQDKRQDSFWPEGRGNGWRDRLAWVAWRYVSWLWNCECRRSTGFRGHFCITKGITEFCPCETSMYGWKSKEWTSRGWAWPSFSYSPHEALQSSATGSQFSSGHGKHVGWQLL